MGMTEQEKREKVIKGLKCVAETYKFYLHDLATEAIDLLKAQEPVKPIMHYVQDGKRSSAAWQCGNCLIDVGYGANYCYNCGRRVKWE